MLLYKLSLDEKTAITLDPRLLSKENTYIMCQPYSYSPHEAFDRAVNVTKFMRQLGLTVFSPILHTHWYDMRLKLFGEDYSENYYAWDFALYQALSPNVTFVFSTDWKRSYGCREEMDWATAHGYEIIFIDEIK